MKIGSIVFGMCAAITLGGCSGEGELGAASETHVWEDREETIDKAVEVEKVLSEAAASQLGAIQSQSE